MKKGWIIFILLIAILIVGGSLIRRKDENKDEHIENIEKNQTKIVLYFSNEKTGELEREYRYVNINEIKDNMEATIINELLKGPENKDLVSQIPIETKVNNVSTEKRKNYNRFFKRI